MPDYLSRKDAAEYLKTKGLQYTYGTLTKLASSGGGPLYRLFGSRAVYTPADLDAWIEVKLSAPRGHTSEAA
jgi:hypothetical protein